MLSLSDRGTAAGAPVGTKFTMLSYTVAWDGGTFFLSNFGFIADGATFDFGQNTFEID